MREYNFPVRAAHGNASDVLFWLALDARFSATEMLSDYPRNMVQPFLDIVVGSGKHRARFKAVAPNTIETSSPAHAHISDADRAILMNLIDFGQDFESPRSTTVSELVFPMAQPGGQISAYLLEALARRNAEAVAFMNEVMLQFPPEDEYSTRTWPEEFVERYYFGIAIDYADALGEAEIAWALRVIDCLHDVNMWNGFSTDNDTAAALASGGSGISVEIGAEDGAIIYRVERPVCDPALSILMLVENIERITGAKPRSWRVHVEAGE